MATPRSLLVDPENALHYHIVSRCVRGSWLCGWDPVNGKDYSYRKDNLEARLFRLVNCFAVELHGFAIMSNHFHLVVHYDPLASLRWSDTEVAERWVEATTSESEDDNLEARRASVEALCAQPEQITRLRHRLGSMSAFMQQLKQPIARQANLEDGVSGHFFEQRFYSGALLSEQALLAAMAYVDLNPVRAQIARDIEQCEHTSIARRLTENSRHRLEALLQPLASGLASREDDVKPEGQVSITLAQYIDALRAIIELEQRTKATSSTPIRRRIERWAKQVATLRKRQRAFGFKAELESWLGRHGMRPLEAPFV